MRRLLLLAILCCCLVYLTLDVQGSWDFAIRLRGGKLVPIILAGLALSASTVALQAITRNPLLTPSLLGIDSFYLMSVSLLVVLLGPEFLNDLGSINEFLLFVSLMIPVCTGLLWLLLRFSNADVQRLVMMGLVLTMLFRSVSQFGQRVLSPTDFAAVQVRSFGRFHALDWSVPMVAGIAIAVCLYVLWVRRVEFDLLALNSKLARSHGVDPENTQLWAMGAICGLVVVATALVGPIVFLGLLATALARQVKQVRRVSSEFQVAGMLGVLILLSGQIVGEHLMDLVVPTPLLVEAIGGLVFIFLLFRQAKRWS